MEKATVSRLKNALSAYLREVRAGQSVLVCDRDVPIARIERVEDGSGGNDCLALLAAQGITRPPRESLSARHLRKLLGTPLPRAVGLLEALREERRAER